MAVITGRGMEMEDVMTSEELAALNRAALRDLIADTAADLPTQNPVWTAGCLADALLATGKLVLVDDGAVERMARAIGKVLAFDVEPDVRADELTHEERCKIATAALETLGVKP